MAFDYFCLTALYLHAEFDSLLMKYILSNPRLKLDSLRLRTTIILQVKEITQF